MKAVAVVHLLGTKRNMAAGDVGVRTINPSQPTLKENEPPFSLCVGHGFSSPLSRPFFRNIYVPRGKWTERGEPTDGGLSFSHASYMRERGEKMQEQGPKQGGGGGLVSKRASDGGGRPLLAGRRRRLRTKTVRQSLP